MINDANTPNDDVELYQEAFMAAIDTYRPFGFEPHGFGKLYYPPLDFLLQEFHSRHPDETPFEHALRSAYEAGRAVGRNEGAAK